MANIGDEVGGRRWPLDSAHPDCWQPPCRGIVISPYDPRAWEGTFAFPGTMYPQGPTEAQVQAHVAATNSIYFCDGRYKLIGQDKVPVAWDFGSVTWDYLADLRPYAEELAAWEIARSQAYAERMNAKLAQSTQ